jgi:magnesium transporter
MQGLGDAETIRQLGEVFSLHPLALEDAVSQHQHVKMDQYQGHLFIAARMVEGPKESTTRQLSIFLTDEVVITLDPEPDDLLPLLRPRLEDALSQLRLRGPDFLVYAILDLVLDQYFPVLEQFGEDLDAIEDRIFTNPAREIIHQVHDIRVQLRDVRRIVWQMRETLNLLMRDPTHLVSDETRTYLRDCHDHAVQLVELLEIDHETCSDLRDVHLSAVSNRMNEIMMVLTIMASIFIPLGFIASLYGMNFNPKASPLNMPELDWYFGYPFALGLMAFVAIALLLYFRKRGWITRSSDAFDDQERSMHPDKS